MPTIDAHAHLISVEAVEGLQRELPAHAPTFEDRASGRFLVYPSGRESGPLPAGMTDLAVRLADMDRTGVDVQLLSPSPPQFGYGLAADVSAVHSRIVNDATLALADAAPDRFLALLTLPLPHIDAALAELERAASHPLVRGIELGANIGGLNLDDASLEPLWAQLERRSLFVLVHAAPADSPQYSRHFLRNLVGNPADSTLAIASLIFGGVAERYPRLAFCFVHGGGFAPYQIGRWDRGWNLREDLRRVIPRPPSTYLAQFYFDSLTHDTASLAFLGARVGWPHVVLGSDYCFDMASDDPVADVRALGLAPDDERAVLGDTIAAILDRARPTGGETV
jgi:aminocarboxymuconate-semialdehyde decarboxylase